MTRGRFGEWSEPGGRDMDGKPDRVSERERTNQSPLPVFRTIDWRILPNKLRIGLAASILRTGFGMADENWPTHVSDSQSDPYRRGNSALVEDGRF